MKVISTSIEVNPLTYQPLLKVVFEEELTLELMQDLNTNHSLVDADEVYLSLGRQMIEAIREHQKNNK